MYPLNVHSIIQGCIEKGIPFVMDDKHREAIKVGNITVSLHHRCMTDKVVGENRIVSYEDTLKGQTFPSQLVLVVGRHKSWGGKKIASDSGMTLYWFGGRTGQVICGACFEFDPDGTYLVRNLDDIEATNKLANAAYDFQKCYDLMMAKSRLTAEKESRRE